MWVKLQKIEKGKKGIGIDAFVSRNSEKGNKIRRRAVREEEKAKGRVNQQKVHKLGMYAGESS